MRQYPIGAEVSRAAVSFRVWAPDHAEVGLFLEDRKQLVRCAPEEAGYFSAVVPNVRPGDLYRFRLGDALLPDPASRAQPEGVHGPSAVVDPSRFAWTDAKWRGTKAAKQVLYELHIGTFTREGTFQAAIAELPRLAALGVTAIEIMPVAEYGGRFGWGSDGVDLFAPHHAYGTPDDLRALVDAAHAHGLGAILDVVYNHLGPEGNYLSRFARAFFDKARPNEWGEAINFASPGVRAFYVANAAYWIREFHFDGLRFDALQAIHDDSPVHVMTDLVSSARAAAGSRSVYLVAENEAQTSIRRHGLDAQWNDDMHHSAVVALTGRRQAYLSDHAGTAQELVSAARWGYLFQGQRYAWQNKRRGQPALDAPPHAFVAYLENHDQVANSPEGARLIDRTTHGRLRAMTAYLLLCPATPMLFQGQELGVSTPFVYFADHPPELASAVREGRFKFLTQFPDLATPAAQARLDDPADPATFDKCKLDPSQADAKVVSLFTDLLLLRRSDPAFAQEREDRIHGAVLASDAFMIRFSSKEDRLLVVNLGQDLHLAHAPEPLLAPPRPDGWKLVWSSDDVRYGGAGIAPVEADDGWHVPGHAAVVLG
jgi:maltooligosyltrehalose trehalohydrolase